MNPTDYKAAVIEVYPDAVCYDLNNSRRFGGTGYHLYKITSHGSSLCLYQYSEDTAWQSAFNHIQNLKNEKK